RTPQTAKRKVRACPRCSAPVGLGATRPTTTEFDDAADMRVPERQQALYRPSSGLSLYGVPSGGASVGHSRRASHSRCPPSRSEASSISRPSRESATCTVLPLSLSSVTPAALAKFSVVLPRVPA